MAAKLTADFKKQIAALVADFGYLDEPQENLLDLFIDAAAEKLFGAGVPVQEDNPEYKEAVMMLSAHKYVKRTPLATAAGSGDKDVGYETMVHNYVYRLRYPEAKKDA